MENQDHANLPSSFFATQLFREIVNNPVIKKTETILLKCSNIFDAQLSLLLGTNNKVNFFFSLSKATNLWLDLIRNICEQLWI